MSSIPTHVSLLAVALFFGATLVSAQETHPQGHTRHSRAYSAAQQGDSNGIRSSGPVAEQSNNSQQPTNTATTSIPSSSEQPLTGAEQFTLSHMGSGHSYFIPSLQYGQSWTSSGTSTFPTSRLESISTISGTFSFHHLWRRYNFTAQYSGVGLLNNTHASSNVSAHNLSVSQRINGKRSSLLLADVATYFPESRYGYARFSGGNTFAGIPYGYGGLFTGSTGGLDNAFLPGQSILTGPSSQVGNSIVAEYNYLTTQVSNITLTGSYVSLFFPGSQYINNSDIVIRFGYNRSISRKNSLGLYYQAGIFRFGSLGGNFTNHIISFVFRRTISHRLALELGAGPQINRFDNTPSNQNMQLTWETSARLTYQLERLSLRVDYLHYTSSGSGIFRGARTDMFSLNTSIPFSRAWGAGLSIGYAYNTTLQGPELNTAGLSYNSWYSTINLHHTLNRWMSLFVGYNLRQQMSSATTCIGPACGTFYAQQYLTFGLDWHKALIGLE